jgi:hypothetical protein
MNIHDTHASDNTLTVSNTAGTTTTTMTRKDDDDMTTTTPPPPQEVDTLELSKKIHANYVTLLLGKAVETDYKANKMRRKFELLERKTEIQERYNEKLIEMEENAAIEVN